MGKYYKDQKYYPNVMRCFVLQSWLIAILLSPLLAHAEENPAVAPLSEMVVITVDKAALKASLTTWPADFRQAKGLREFPIAIGKAEGDKQRQGDNRTPEGIYFTQNHISDSELPEKYGPLAIPIDFPNPMDRVEQKTGYGIWLHGVEYAGRIEEAKVTEGCVAFYNDDIQKLGAWLKPFQATVIIASDKSQVNKEEDLAAVQAVTTTWMKAWQDRNIEGYIAGYDEGFRHQGMDKAAYRDYKSRVFGSYKQMKVDFTNLRVFSHPKYAVAIMNQDFNGDGRFISIGRKVLYLLKQPDGSFRIRREIFDEHPVTIPSFTAQEIASLNGEGGSEKKNSPNL
jgi:murein L,D-transpeptidase YafK